MMVFFPLPKSSGTLDPKNTNRWRGALADPTKNGELRGRGGGEQGVRKRGGTGFAGQPGRGSVLADRGNGQALRLEMNSHLSFISIICIVR
ncbi:hypothetical protein N658DRAFT_353175 [Parathielavia hyrcaniae]|uniref:Uncharacterized protein n=1 Tax=Parathielavia hyrcaniae TaxID=113614 RepID=A0AAN6Q247_9PEZI|nr:hypothetical protein N658DRAFT_353175 [Parathielavia hyrcaniae]